MTKYLLLMRHGKHEAAPAKGRSFGPRQPAGRRLSTEGEKETRQVIEKLVEVLKELKGDTEPSIEGGTELSIDLKEIWRATTDEATKTADVVRQVLGDLSYKYVPRQDLNPMAFKGYENSGKHKDVARCFKARVLNGAGNDAVLLVGHQPFLGWLAHELTAKRIPILSWLGYELPGNAIRILSWLGFDLTGEAIPMVHSEIACIAFDDLTPQRRARGRLRWVLSPSNDSMTEDLTALREKIKSKMEVTKLLSVFITTALAFLLGSMIDEQKVAALRAHGGAIWALNLSAAAFFVAIALYLATLYAYDRLLMPTRFWAEAPLPTNPKKRPKWLAWRPPGSALWVVYQNMMRVWSYLFMSATYAVLVGLVLLAYAVFHLERPEVFWTGVVIGLILFRFWYRHFRPRLGTQD
jgi:phosphohistidine phosphatase SixA